MDREKAGPFISYISKVNTRSTHDSTAKELVNILSLALAPDEIRILGVWLKYNHDDVTTMK